MSFFVARDGHRVGPITEDQISDGLATGIFSLTDLCWTEGMAEWLALSFLVVPAKAPARVPPPLPREIKPLNPVPAPLAASTFSLPLAATQPLAEGKVDASGHATASLVCGVLALAVGIFVFPAIICGHIALWQIKNSGKSSKYRWRARVGLVLGYGRLVFVLCFGLFFLGIVFGWFEGLFPKPTPESRVKSSISAIVAELDTYAGNHGGSYPATLEEDAKAAKLVGDFSKLFTPPTGWSEQPGFKYVGAGAQRSADGSRTPILMSVCRGPGDERVVITKAGSVIYGTLGLQF